jgi:hypothetical protein
MNISYIQYRNDTTIKKVNKYNARITKVDGYLFHSNKEAERYKELKLLKKSEEVNFFLCQVPFRLPGKITYRADFAVFWKNGRTTFEDVKGIDTNISKKKVLYTYKRS